jgi:signal peptidase I
MTKSKKEDKKVAQPVQKDKFLYFLREMGFVLGIFFILHSFVVAGFEVPTGSMENEIMAGDWLLANKFVYGGTTPKTIPLTDIRIPSFKLPSLWKVERNDVMVFEHPGYRDEVEAAKFAYFSKRCIAVAGDTLQIVNRVVYVNGNVISVPRNFLLDNPGTILPAGYADPRIFPKGAPFNEDNYGPIVIPKKGEVINITADNYERWGTFIKREKHSFEFLDGKSFIDGKEQCNYTVERDYIFGMGDHRDNSLDSRYWGFIPAESVIGTPIVVYWSWNPDLSLLDIVNKINSIRWNRVGTLVR